MEPFASLLDDPVLNPGIAVQQQQQQQQAPARKRPRSTSPHPSSKRQKLAVPDVARVAADLKNPSKRNDTLQTLLKLSSSHDLNYTLGGEQAGTSTTSGDQVLHALTDICYECLDMGYQHQRPESVTGAGAGAVPFPRQEAVFSAEGTWTEPPTKERAQWARHAQIQLEQPKHKQANVLQTILIIFRNLSFVSANVRLMRHNEHVWSILIGCLYETHGNYTEDSTSGVGLYNLALHSLHTLLNMAQQPQLDVTGQLTVCDTLFLHDACLNKLGWGGMWLAKKFDSREDVVDVPTSMVLEIALPHLVQIWSLFSALGRVIHDIQTPRAVLLVALDLLKECMDQVGGVVAVDAKEEIPSMSSIMKQLPRSILERLVDFLWIPRLGPDALDYVNPLHNVVSRVSTLKLRMGYDATVDTDLRDRALDVLVPWLALQEEVVLSKYLGSSPNGWARLYNAVLPILTTTVGRNDAPVLGAQLLKYMSSSPTNQTGMMYIQDRIVELASRDARMAQLAFTHLYKSSSSSKAQEKSESEDDESGTDERIIVV
jgi:hypothetical protein